MAQYPASSSAGGMWSLDEQLKPAVLVITGLRLGHHIEYLVVAGGASGGSQSGGGGGAGGALAGSWQICFCRCWGNRLRWSRRQRRGR